MCSIKTAGEEREREREREREGEGKIEEGEGKREVSSLHVLTIVQMMKKVVVLF